MNKTDILPLASEFPPVDEIQWRALVEKALKGQDFEKALVSHTLDGLRMGPLYTLADDAPRPAPLGQRAAISPGQVGQSPRTRPGTSPWQVQQTFADVQPESSNAAIREDLAGGATGVTLRLAAPEQVGLAVTTPGDLARALEGVPLETTPLCLEPGAEFARAADMLQALWQARGLDKDKIRGGFGADPLGSLARAGGLPLSLEQTLQAAAALAQKTRAHFPHMTALTADARVYHNGGASAAEELACLAATTVAYLRACEAEGLAPQDGLPQIAFALAADDDFFASIAKLRAARALIARIAQAVGAGAARIWLMATTSERMLAKRDVYTNMLRASVACAGAGLGGADAVTLLPFTWPLGQPDAFARRFARNVQLVLMEEASLARVADPAGGSWAVERLTRDLAAKAWELFQAIEAQGGMGIALSTGHVQRMLAKTAEARADLVAHGEIKLTGINSFPHLEETPVAAEPWPLPEELDAAITVEPIPLHRPAAPFEALRDKADAFLAARAKPCQIFLALLGPRAESAERAAFAAGLFAAGGIFSAQSEPLDSAGDARRAFSASGARIACLCGSEAAYEKLARQAAMQLTAAGAKHIYLAGRPGEMRAGLKQAGVGTFLHEGCDMLAVLRDAQSLLGVR